MKKKAAVIDMGTNTFHLLMVSMDQQFFETLYKEKVPVKLGQGGINKNTILPDAQKRAFHTLQHFKNLIKGENIDDVFAFATSAVRNADNGKDFIEKVRREIGFTVDVIHGEREADLIYKGIRLSKSLNQKNSLMMDIGGGSVEFIIGNEREALWKGSFEIGAQRMLDLFHYHDPILNLEIDNLRKYLYGQLQPLLAAIEKHEPRQLVGASGTFDTLTDIYFATKAVTKSKFSHSYRLPIPEFHKIAEDLLNSNREERLTIPGMVPMRVDMIVVAACLIRFVLNHVSPEHLSCSTYSLKEGALSELMAGDETKHTLPSPSWQYE
jgi:exopolyphosphatase / guanosine-5'-triphosphate,3'-diphosphate pyrophosphatase